MEIILKENVIFKPYNCKIQLKEKILDFIMESKTDKILFKGNPTEINYKLLKKILPLEQIYQDNRTNSMSKFIDNRCDNIREVYSEFLSKIQCDYCLIYKV